jgi:putative membrane-bound dehydrogenase-like protein
MSRIIPSCLYVLLLTLATSAPGADTFPSYPAVEPSDAAKTIRVKHGFTMDLIAAEPLLASPVAVAYDEDGIGYVVEMRDYPYTDRKTHQAWKDNTTDAPIGRVRKLIDRDGDGVFDESHILADGLSWPTGITCWKGGVFVTATPDIWYLKDTDGDHRADVREKVFTGFRKYNVQAVINSPLWGLDNRITFAGGSNGGQVSSLKHPEVSPLRVARNDLRIDPRNATIEAIAGGARFGQGMDDWGNRFLCNIRNPAQHVVFDGTLSTRNPLLPVPNHVHDARESGDTLPVKRISPLEPWRDLRARRWVAENHAVPRSELVGGGVFTSAAGITIYRGAAYPAEYRGQAFVAEVANNLVQRQTVVKDGVTFRIETADKDAEFIASSDLWFRAVNFTNAPDGTLHVVDMYRETIEHPWSIPEDILAKLDLESGRDRGRLYRLSPPGFKAPKPPRLGSASISELVATLENPNSWWREAAQRLLFEKQDRDAIEPLRGLLARSRSELARLHALWTLDGLGALTEEDLQRGLGDASAGVREHAVKLATSRLAKSPELRARVFALARDPEIRVRYHVAFAAGGIADDAAVTAALEVLAQNPGDRWVRAAALSAPPDQCAKIARRFVSDAKRIATDEGREVMRQLAFVAGAHNQPANIEAIHAALIATKSGPAEESFWTGLGDGLKQAGRNLRSAFRDPQSAVAKRAAERLEGAMRTAASNGAPSIDRIAAVKVLGYDDFARVRPTLATLATAGENQPLQIASVRALSMFAQPEVAKTLLEPWAGYTPAVREEVLTALLARRDRVGALIAAMENKVVSPGQVSAARRTQILANPDAALKVRAEKVFGQNSTGSRAEVVERYKASLTLAGTVGRGAKIYDNVCAACHRFSGRGVDIGPNLETVRGWDREKLLLNILDPNREVAGNYIAYVIDLKDGSSVSGMIAEENAASIKLKRIGAPEETILRQNIAKITSSAISLMPDGLESTLPLQDMADLLAYLAAP